MLSTSMVENLFTECKMSKNNANYILDLIRERQGIASSGLPKMGETDWKRFASKFVDSIDNSPVNENTGETNKEFLESLKVQPKRYSMSVDAMKSVSTSKNKLRDFLKKLDQC